MQHISLLYRRFFETRRSTDFTSSRGWSSHSLTILFYQSIGRVLNPGAKDGRIPFVLGRDCTGYDARVSKISPNKDYYIVQSLVQGCFRTTKRVNPNINILGRNLKMTYSRISELKRYMLGLRLH
ncbi:hypothetical protein BYT27DRAFT_6850939 [Phlegmacium glaucopus]|nr:hypothetical protein BYT27DRAFT_6850939 [Phlegmacium glaucopus]